MRDMLIHDDYMFCDDCLFAHANGDSPEDPRRDAEVVAGFEALASEGLFPALNDGGPDGHLEFSWRECDCCSSPLGGRRTRFSIFRKALSP